MQRFALLLCLIVYTPGCDRAERAAETADAAVPAPSATPSQTPVAELSEADAIAALNASEEKGPEAVLSVIRLLHHKSASVRVRALQTIEGFGDTAVRALPMLLVKLRDPETEVRVLAAQALGAMGPEAKPGVQGLLKALGDREAAVRLAATNAIGSVGPAARTSYIGESTPIAELKKLADDPDDSVRAAAFEAIANLGGED